MSFDSLLTHRLVLERPAIVVDSSGTVEVDDMGGYVTEVSVIAEDIPALVQEVQQYSRNVREAPATNEQGVETGDYVVFMRPRDIRSSDRLYFSDPADWGLVGLYGVPPETRLEVVGMRNAGGQDHHLQVDVRVTVAPATEEVEGS